jgi:hypothetical protein
MISIDLIFFNVWFADSLFHLLKVFLVNVTEFSEKRFTVMQSGYEQFARTTRATMTGYVALAMGSQQR